MIDLREVFIFLKKSKENQKIKKKSGRKQPSFDRKTADTEQDARIKLGLRF